MSAEMYAALENLWYVGGDIAWFIWLAVVLFTVAKARFPLGLAIPAVAAVVLAGPMFPLWLQTVAIIANAIIIGLGIIYLYGG